MKINFEYLNKLATMMSANDLSEIHLEDEEQLISLKREKIVEEVQQVVMPATVTSQVISTPKPQKEEVTNNTPKGTPVISPMVGTFFSAPSPDAKPFVQVGDTIAAGQVVCIVEAMKLMNEIETEVSGKITEICVKNGDSVEFGQILMYVE